MQKDNTDKMASMKISKLMITNGNSHDFVNDAAGGV